METAEGTFVPPNAWHTVYRLPCPPLSFLSLGLGLGLAQLQPLVPRTEKSLPEEQRPALEEGPSCLGQQCRLMGPPWLSYLVFVFVLENIKIFKLDP